MFIVSKKLLFFMYPCIMVIPYVSPEAHALIA